MRCLAIALALAACGHSGGSSLVDGPPGGDDDAPPGDGPPGGDADGAIDPDAPPDASLSCPQGTWCIETSPVAGTLLHAVYAIGSGDVFAVGDGGTILRRQNDTWTKMTSNSTANLRGVWGASSSDVWAVGGGGALLHFDGTTWTPQTVTAIDLEAVWGSSSTDVFVAATGAALHWNGAQWTTQNLAGSFVTISGTGPNDVWMTGENTRLHHFTTAWDVGGSTNPFGTGGPTTYFAVAAIAANDVWTSCGVVGKETMNFVGASPWTSHATTTTFFAGLWGNAANNVWGAGQSGRIGHYNGSAWSVETVAGVSSQLWSVTGSGTHVWIVGDASTILHRD